MQSLKAARSMAAYVIVNIAAFSEAAQAELIDDAAAGGKTYGLRVVEEYINGPARQPVYGVYKDDEELWNETKAQLGIEEEALDAEEPDEDALREAAQQQADADAARVDAAHKASVDKVVNGEGDTNTNRAKRSGR